MRHFRLREVINGWARIPLRYRGMVVALIPVVGLMATLGTWSWIRGRAMDANDWIDHTQMVIRESDRLLITVLNAETGVRGYVITGDEIFLAPYNQAVQTFPRTAQRLTQLLKDSPAQQQRLHDIVATISQQFDVLQRRITLRQQFQPPLGRDTEWLYQGKDLMDQVRSKLAQFQTVEQQLLIERQNTLERIRRLLSTTVWTIGGFSILSSIVAILMFNKIDWEMESQASQLRQGRSLLRGIITNVVDGMITLNQPGTIESFNPASADMFGYRGKEMIGKPLEFLLAALPGSQNQLSRVGNALSAVKRQQMIGRHQNGTLFPIDISISEIETGNQWIAIIRDITELKQTEAALQAHAHELAQLNLILAKTNADFQDRNRELDQFAYVASHDLKAPLRAIANLSEWLEEDLKNSLSLENQRQMRLLRGRVHRMEALINGLLQYSRIGRSELPIERVDVATLLSEVLEVLDPPATFKITIAANMPVLETKRMLIHQVFSNLIGNAIRHHPHTDGKVTVTTWDEGDRYRFSIADNGAGIAPEYQVKIFTIFQTLEPRDKVENTGIGLTIVKKIVETEGGEIFLTSDIDSGSTFEFTWLKHSLTSSA